LLCFFYADFSLHVLQAEEILGDPRTSGRGGIYYYSERADRLIDLASFRDKLWQVTL
jgi:nuclear pore complex protein Nup205